MPLVTEAISLFEPDLSLKDLNIFQFDRILYVLANYIQYKNNKKNDSLKRTLIRHSLRRYSKYKLQNIHYFKRALNAEFNGFYRKKFNSYYCIFPMNIDNIWFKNKRSVTIDKKKVLFRNYDHVNKYYIKGNARAKYTLKKSIYGDFTFLIVNQYERGELRAINEAIKVVELFRSFVNLTTNLGNIRTSYGSKNPLSDYGPPKHALCFDDKKNFLSKGDIWVHESHLNKRKPTINSNLKLVNIFKNIKMYNNNRNNKLIRLLNNILLLYTHALDDLDYRDSFLHFWQILEMMFSYGRTDYNTIKRRIKNLFVDKKTTPVIVDIVCDKRNQFVHNGLVDDLDQSDIHRIKTLVDSSIMFLMGNSNRFRNKKNMIYFLDNLPESKTELKEKIRVLKYVIDVT